MAEASGSKEAPTLKKGEFGQRGGRTGRAWVPPPHFLPTEWLIFLSVS